MKLKQYSTLFLLAGIVLLSACSEEKVGESPEQIAENIKIDSEEIQKESTPQDTVVVQELTAPVPPPPPPVPPHPGPGPDPIPWPPEPEPEPEPIPEPIDVPEPAPIIPIPEIAPAFPGDSEGDTRNMNEFVSKNVRYPEIAREMGIQGRVYIEFVVEKDGNLNDIKVVRGVSKELDEESLRVIKAMPKWIPGEVGGKKVRTKMYVPITFRLD